MPTATLAGLFIEITTTLLPSAPPAITTCPLFEDEQSSLQASALLCRDGSAMSGASVQRRRDPIGTRTILGSLPDWFGIDEAIETYVNDAAHMTSYLALLEDQTVGVALVNRHFPEAAELHLIAVHAEHRGKGIGTSLVRAVAEDLRKDQCQILNVHTVGPSFSHPPYAETRHFYRNIGFIPLQEVDGIDWSGPTLILVLPLAKS